MYPGLDGLTWFDGLTQLILGKPVNFFFYLVIKLSWRESRFYGLTWFEGLIQLIQIFFFFFFISFFFPVDFFICFFLFN